jgi:hypothetical protein
VFTARIDGLEIAPTPFCITDMPVVDKTMELVPLFTIVMSVPIGKATDALVGIVIV